MLEPQCLTLYPLELLLSFPMIHRVFTVLSFSRPSLQGVLLRRKLPQEKISYRDRTVTLFQLFVKARSSLCSSKGANFNLSLAVFAF
jgi:hypothetical protein